MPYTPGRHYLDLDRQEEREKEEERQKERDRQTGEVWSSVAKDREAREKNKPKSEKRETNYSD